MNALLLPNNLSYLKEYIKYFKILHRMKTMLTDTKHTHKILSQLKSMAKLSQILVDKGFLPYLLCITRANWSYLLISLEETSNFFNWNAHRLSLENQELHSTRKLSYSNLTLLRCYQKIMNSSQPSQSLLSSCYNQKDQHGRRARQEMQ